MKTKEYKEYKGLKKENLRDNMSNLELVLNMLAEVSTTEISKGKNPKTLDENIQVAKEGGSVAKNARLDIETKTGNKIITKQNAKDITLLQVQIKVLLLLNIFQMRNVLLLIKVKLNLKMSLLDF
jgi:hypothetical protein